MQGQSRQSHWHTQRQGTEVFSKKCFIFYKEGAFVKVFWNCRAGDNNASASACLQAAQTPPCLEMTFPLKYL